MAYIAYECTRQYYGAKQGARGTLFHHWDSELREFQPFMVYENVIDGKPQERCTVWLLSGWRDHWRELPMKRRVGE